MRQRKRSITFSAVINANTLTLADTSVDIHTKGMKDKHISLI